MQRAMAFLFLPSLFLAATAFRYVSAQSIGFEPVDLYATGHEPEAFVIVDLNADGSLDVAIANSSDSFVDEETVTVLLGDGEGGFAPGANFPVNAGRPEGIAAAFLDGDAFLDLVTSNFEGNSVSILLGNGDGSFATPSVIGIPGGPRFVVVHDFTGDGSMDLATANFDSDSVSILEGDGAGGFLIIQSILVGNGPEVIALGQFTADPNIDLVTSDANANTVTVLQGDGTGNFSPGATHLVGMDPRFVLAADLNGDSLDDLIVANNDSNTVTIERNDGALGFTTVTTLSFSSPAVQLGRPVYLALADMDGDGGNDILVTWDRDGLFSVFPQGSDPFEYGMPSAHQAGNTPVGIGAADLDADGDLDVVVTNALDDTAGIYLSHLTDPGVIIDDGVPGTMAIGPWPPSTIPFTYGPTSLFSKLGTRYSWEALLPAPGAYEVLLWWTVTPDRSPKVPVEIQHSEGRSGVIVDQTQGIGIWHPLGVFSFNDKGVVIVTSPQDDLSVSADAVRFRAVAGLPPGPARGKVSVIVKPKPDEIQVDSDTVIAFHGNITVDNNAEPEDFVAAIFLPVGEGEESLEILHCRLYLDSNSNGTFDAGDRQLGEPLAFGSDIRAITFDGFAETLADGSSTDFFVLADKVQQPPLGSVIILGALSAAVALRKKARRKAASLAILLVFALPFALSSLAGCGNNGSGKQGGGPAEGNLQLELSSIVTRGSGTGNASIDQGLPATGFTF